MRLSHVGLMALACLFASCVQYHYTPNFLHTPAIDKKGDGLVSANINADVTGLKGDFHASYSPVRYITLSTNFLRVNNKYRTNDFLAITSYEYETKGHLWEAGAGAYYPLGFGTFALYAGYGVGRMRHDYDIGRIADLRINRYYIQPTYTFKSKFMRLGLAFRLSRLHYPYADIDYRIDQSDIDGLKLLETNTPFLMKELGGNIGFYVKPFTFSFHGVLASHLHWATYQFDSTNIGMGIGVELQDLKFKKQDKSKHKKKRRK